MFSSFISFFLILSLLGPFSDQITNNKEIKKISHDFPKKEADLPLIRISVLENSGEVKITTQTEYSVKDMQGRVLFRGAKMAPTLVKGTATGVQLGPQTFRRGAIIVQSAGGVKLGKFTYRHALEFWNDPQGRISVVNELEIEDYLKGVLPHEVNPKWGMEALKAQAVAARTYALFKAIENKDQKYAMSKSVLSQVYGGKGGESFNTNKAVALTRGQVLSHKNKIFPGYFHSTCGGTTTRPEFNWSVEGHPVMKGVTCKFCRDSPHYRWQSELKLSDIEQKLKARGFSVFGLKSLDLADVDASGRARNFILVDSKGKKKLPANDFRVWVDPFKFKSTFISSLEIEGGKVLLKGRGWGHGVGLCQYGIKKLAELGYSYEDILQYYYPGAAITTIAPPPQEAPADKILNPIKEQINEYL